MEKNTKYNPPEWLKEALNALRPPENISVSECADKYRILDARTSAEPGPWRTERTPYLQGIMDSFKIPEVETITFLKPTQVGGTESLFNIFLYIILQDPSPTMILYPTLDLAEYTSKNRIQPMIKKSPEVNKHFNEAESKLLELQFDGMYTVLAGANSAASLSSRPIKFLLIDERDKFPKFTGKEANPVALAKERQKTFANSKKTIEASSPTTRQTGIYKSFSKADTQYEFFVPCPHCGFYQTFQFKNLKWGKNLAPNEALSATYYQCENCNGQIKDFHKTQMLKTGEWRAVKKGGLKHIGFRMNSIYSPWVRFGDVAYEFLVSKDDPELLMNFINSWLAEPWEDVATKFDEDIILEKQDIYSEGVVPDDAYILTGGVDVQKNCFYWTIRAWGLNMTSWNIAHGICETWDDVDKIMNSTFKKKNEQKFQVSLCAIDSGNDTDSVYDFIASHSEWAVPIKGSSRALTSRYKMSSIDKGTSRANGMMLYILDTNQYKDMIAGRIKRQKGKGCWHVYNGCDKLYAQHICSEEKILEKSGGQEYWVWKPKSSTAQNHWLDCEVYAALAADLMHVRYLSEDDVAAFNQIKTTSAKSVEKQEIKENNSGDWISSETKDWI